MFFRNLFTEFHENAKHDLVADTRTRTDGRTGVVSTKMFYLPHKYLPKIQSVPHSKHSHFPLRAQAY